MDQVGEGGRITLDIPEVARRLGISKNSAYKAAQEGQLPALRIGKRFVVPIAQFERWLEQGGKL